MNLLSTIGFEIQNRFAYISGTIYRSDMFLCAKRMGGPPLSGHTKNRDIKENRCHIFLIHPIVLLHLLLQQLPIKEIFLDSQLFRGGRRIEHFSLKSFLFLS